LAVQFHLQTLLNLKLEEPFPAICRIADCACHERKLILEIQCSPISAFEVKSRISDYNSKGYQVIWILHDREFKKRRLSAAEVFLKRHGLFFYTDMNPEGFGHFYHPQTGQKMDLCQVSHPPLKWWKIFMSKWQSLGLGKVLSKWW
jgi:competence protein CoiA